MKKLIAFICAVLIFALGAIAVINYADHNASVFYTQIDNSKMKQIDPDSGGIINFDGSFPYSYTLVCFSESGKEKELTFTASKKLRQGVFIRLTNRPIRGVVGWDEVQYDELPAKVQSKLKSG